MSFELDPGIFTRGGEPGKRVMVSGHRHALTASRKGTAVRDGHALGRRDTCGPSTHVFVIGVREPCVLQQDSSVATP